MGRRFEPYRNMVARGIDVAGHRLTVADAAGRQAQIGYDAPALGAGAVPVRPAVDGLAALGSVDGLHLRHTMKEAHRGIEETVRTGRSTRTVLQARPRATFSCQPACAAPDRPSGLIVAIMARRGITLPPHGPPDPPATRFVFAPV